MGAGPGLANKSGSTDPRSVRLGKKVENMGADRGR
jgi:hypothetical protein